MWIKNSEDGLCLTVAELAVWGTEVEPCTSGNIGDENRRILFRFELFL